ncbi:MAG: aldehyde dehydrogenase family protein [Bdellovibrionia bacterium]
MKTIDQIYINGKFVRPHGTERFDLVDPTSQSLIGQVVLGDEEDARAAIAAAKKAFESFSRTTKEERIRILDRLFAAVQARHNDHVRAMIEEYGGTHQFATASAKRCAESFLHVKNILSEFDFVRSVSRSQVTLEPVGVTAIITPWNASSSFICSKFAMALAAGNTVVVKPSEMSAIQTQVLLECFHEAGLPSGLFNLVNGRGDRVGAELSRNPDIAKISFTGSTVVGKSIARTAADTLKRVTLELGGKSPFVILEDANLDEAVPIAVAACFMNNGQACIAGTRLLVPLSQKSEIEQRVKSVVAQVQQGDPREARNTLGPVVSRKQYERVQVYIRLGLEEGATLLIGGPGSPEGLERGNYVKPTVFTDVTNDMRIAREEIFGPVLSILTYRSEEEAVAIANDTDYGLHAYVSGTNLTKAQQVASAIRAGRVAINGIEHDPYAPFGGFKQSGIGREYGVYGLEEYLEPKAILKVTPTLTSS